MNAARLLLPPLLSPTYQRPRFSPVCEGQLTRRVAHAALVLGLCFSLFYQLGVPLRATHGARVSADEPFYLLTAASLLADGDMELTNDYALQRYRAFYDHPDELWRQSRPLPDGRLLSPHNIGLPLLIAPAYALAGVDGVKAFLGLLGGLVVAVSALLACRVTGRALASFAAAALLGVSAPFFVYATQVYPEMPAALCVSLALLVLLRDRLGWIGVLLLVILMSCLPWLGSKYVAVTAVLALVACLRLAPRQLLVFAVLGAAGAAGYIAFHVAAYGGVTPYGVNAVYFGMDTGELAGAHFQFWNRLYRLAGLWVDGEFGLVRWAPVLLLALPALPWLARQRMAAGWLLVLVFASQFALACFFTITMRGWWFPGRLLIVVLPVLVVAVAWTLDRLAARPWSLAVGAVLGIFTLAVTLALYVETAAGHVALIVDPFDMQWAPFQGIAGIFPVYTSYERATWLLTALWASAGALGVLSSRWLEARPAVSRPAPESPDQPAEALSETS